MQGSATEIPRHSARQKLTVVEENAIYYAAGFVVRKVSKKYHLSDDDRGAAIAGVLNGMIGEDAHSSINATDIYLDYVKTRTVQNDRGKLIHITDDAYRFFRSLEEVTYKTLKEGRSKHEAISHILENPDVDFYWSVITDGLKSDYSSQ